MFIDVRTKPVTGVEDPYVTALVPANAGMGTVAPKKIFSVRLRTGVKAFLTKIGNAVQAGGESSVTFYLLLNGNARVHPYDGSQNQWGDPANMAELPERIPLPQGGLLECYANNSDVANSYNATARAFIEYEDLA